MAIDPAKAVGQHLRALALAGVSVLPKGTGRFEFHLPSTADVPVEDTPPLVQPPGEPKTPGKTLPASESGSKTPAPAASGRDPSPARILEAPSTYQASPAAPGSLDGPYGPELSLEARQLTLDAIRSEVEICTRCTELCRTRRQTVFGVGRINPRLVFVGEGPGADEDRVGEPFVGAAGQKLNKIIAACKMDRPDVYILNTVKCRPPANRNPTQIELDNCWEYAQRQLEVLQPEFICCLGSVAAKRILNTTQSLGQLRQQFFTYRGSRVLVTYHPAYLLRMESANRLVWEDMKLLMKEMGIPV